MAFKEATDCCAGTAVIYGAPDLLKVMQFLNGKAITGCCPVLVRDTIFSLSCPADTSKRMRFDIPCGIAGCTTIVGTIPATASFTFVDLASTQTLAAKTLTIPVIGDFTSAQHTHLTTATGGPIGAKAITVAMLADGTDGELITWNACAVAATVCVGCCGQVLTSNGVGNAPTFQAGAGNPTESFIFAVSDETTDLTTGVDKLKFRMPYAFTVTGIRASLSTVATGAALLTVDVHESGTTIMACCKLVFDASESTTTTAVTPPVVSDTSLACDAEMTVDIDVIGCTTAGRGLKIAIIGTRT